MIRTRSHTSEQPPLSCYLGLLHRLACMSSTFSNILSRMVPADAVTSADLHASLVCSRAVRACDYSTLHEQMHHGTKTYTCCAQVFEKHHNPISVHHKV